MLKDKDNKPIKLPFMPHKIDLGEWAYDHRKGLVSAFIIAVCLAFSSLYVTFKIEHTSPYNTIIMDLENETLEKKEEEKPKIEQQLDFSDIQNLASNENALGLNHELLDDRGAPAEQIYESAEKVNERLQKSRDLYEQGLAEDAAISQRKSQTDASNKTSNVKVEGTVTASFSFKNPVRNAVDLVIPAYMCRGGGRVVIDAVLDNSGRVIAATVNKGSSTADNCMVQAARSSARASRFDLNTDAPARQLGTITYIFIPQ